MKFKRRLKKPSYFNQINAVSFLNIFLLFFAFLMLGAGFAIVPGLNVRLPDVVTLRDLGKVLKVRISGDNTISVQDDRVKLGDLASILRKYKYDTVFIKADKKANVGILAEIWQACKEAGIGKISFVTTQ